MARMVQNERRNIQEKMDDEKLKNLEIIKLTEKFAKAVKNRDKRSVMQITNDNFRIETKILGANAFQEFNLERLHEVLVILNLRETNCHLYKKNDEIQAVFEIVSNWHLNETDFQQGFIRQTFSYCKFSENWKLNHLKTEYLRFSRYNLKQSLTGFLNWIFIKTYKING